MRCDETRNKKKRNQSQKTEKKENDVSIVSTRRFTGVSLLLWFLIPFRFSFRFHLRPILFVFVTWDFFFSSFFFFVLSFTGTASVRERDRHYLVLFFLLLKFFFWFFFGCYDSRFRFLFITERNYCIPSFTYLFAKVLADWLTYFIFWLHAIAL